MSDGYGYDPYGPQPEIIGYDEYGRPVYRRPEAPQEGTYAGQDAYPSYDPYARPSAQQQPGYDPYAGYQEQQGAHPGAYDPYAQQQAAQQQTDWAPGMPAQGGPPQQEQYDPQQDQYGRQQYETAAQQYAPGAQQTGPAAQQPYGEQPYGDPAAGAPSGPAAPGPAKPSPGAEDDYRTEQFSFVEESTDETEDVIDWLKFTESRTERREEARRKGRNRVVALVVVLALLLAGGVGYLWYAGMLPGTGDDGGKGGAAAGEQRDVIVVHLRKRGEASSTALLVDNEGAGQGSTVLLPNSLAVSTEDGKTTTLGRSVEDQGAGPTRDSLNTLLGSGIKGTWRLDAPFLENLVELVGGISVDADTTVPGAKRGEGPQVEQGSARDLDGRAAVAYSTYRAPGEPQTKQLARFGQVMQAVLKKLSTDAGAATKTVESLGQVPDPSLSESQLGASLAKLATHAEQGDYRTRTLPVRADGTLSPQVSEQIVKKILGGSVKNSDPDAAPRVSLKNATGKRGLYNAASVALVNGGYTVVKGGTGAARTRSLVTYAEAGQKARAEEIAKTLELPGSAVRKAKGAANADVTVVLGADYEG
ncbi:LytR C-terminal domain-containing protein [Streptomyces spirodelae]|uniref:LytR C-terminal domain-containing protein n=1 Tax=Streptomyces spirodelae TaxID=2812904 RepID=A0ABS3WMJ9_9ACTN|nr:LytR C-terminal domain-containing protein [Streptomyces spirodelae]MBO8184354.1 LytR C-terminal domain-containing protein [Streptomyces spirodelae]